MGAVNIRNGDGVKTSPKKIFAIVGSASTDSVNEKIIAYVSRQLPDNFEVIIYRDLKQLPHFDPALSADSPPERVTSVREQIEGADGLLICTPEYVFSLPAGLKNLVEWCVATTVFSDKPTGLITASSAGEKAHEQLLVIMETVTARFTTSTALLISGVKGKISAGGSVTDRGTAEALKDFAEAFKHLVHIR